MLADRIEVFSIYANHSHRRRIITVLCQESPLPVQSLNLAHTSTPLALPCSLPFHSSPIIPSVYLHSLLIPLHIIPPLVLLQALPTYLPLLYRCALWRHAALQDFPPYRHTAIGSGQANYTSSWVVSCTHNEIIKNIIEWSQDGYRSSDRERELLFSARESSSSSGVISLIHGGHCANILLKISWQHTQTALMLELSLWTDNLPTRPGQVL